MAPKAKLADFAGSDENELKTEDDQFYDFKTLLIRLIGNLAHKNKKNQDYVSILITPWIYFLQSISSAFLAGERLENIVNSLRLYNARRPESM